jgi:hypothetical protein
MIVTLVVEVLDGATGHRQTASCVVDIIGIIPLNEVRDGSPALSFWGRCKISHLIQA